MEFSKRDEQTRPNVGIRRVIAVVFIGVAAAIVLPVFQRPGCGCGQSDPCIGNMREIGLAMIQYAQDNDYRLPLRQYADPLGHVVSWRMSLDPYTRSKLVHISPSDPASALPDIERDGFNRSFAVNSTADANPDVSGPFADNCAGSVVLTSVEDQARVIGVVESTAAYNDFNPLFPDAFTQPTRKGTDAGHLFVRRDKGVDHMFCMFLDSHFKSLDPRATLGGSGEPSMWTIHNMLLDAQERATAGAVVAYGTDHATANGH